MIEKSDNTVSGAMETIVAPSPAELATPGKLWVVRAGALHLFLARVSAEGEMLARHPLCQLDAEDVLCNLHGAVPEGWCVVAVGTTETRLSRHSVAEEDAAWIAERTALWLARLRQATDVQDDAAEQQEIFAAAIALQQQREIAERARIGRLRSISTGGTK